MTPEDIARKFEQRAGYALIDYAPVALPLYRLTIDAITLQHRPIAAIHEFILRTISTGLSDINAIVGFLGLDASVVRAAVNQLVSDRYLNADESGESVTFLPKGREVLTKAMESVPTDEMLVFIYDRILRKPIHLFPHQYVAPANVDPKETVEVRAYPADGPSISDLRLFEVLQVLDKHSGGKSEFGRDLLKIKRIVRRTRLFRPAVGLVYKKNRSSEIQIAFVVDDARNEELEHAFEAAGGPKKMGFVRAIEESVADTELKRYLGAEIRGLLLDQAAIDNRRIAVSLARFKAQVALGKAEQKGGLNAPSARAEKLKYEEASIALDEAERALEEFGVRPASPYELKELFAKALRDVKRSLHFSLRSHSFPRVDSPLFRQLEALLRRNVRIVVAFDRGQDPDRLPQGVQQLEKFSNFEVTQTRTSRFFYLVCDEKFAVISNRPPIGSSDKVRIFRQMAGCILNDRELIRSFVKRITTELRH